MPHYKEGKQKQLISFQEIREKVEAASRRLTREAEAYFWLLYYSGARKSEIYERVVGDCQVTDSHFILDITLRKKGSAQTDPLEFPLWFPGIKKVCEQLEKARSKRKTRKLLERWIHQKRITSRVEARWLFPNIHRTQAARIVKQILGSQYYPHFLRLNRITELCSDPGANLTRIKSFSGIKSTRIIEENYMGVSKKEQKAAVDFMAKQIKENQQKNPDEK